MARSWICLSGESSFQQAQIPPLRRKMLAMNIWLTVRTFIAIFFVAFGIGLMVARSEDMRLMVGALLAAFGLTFMLRMALVLRER